MRPLHYFVRIRDEEETTLSELDMKNNNYSQSLSLYLVGYPHMVYYSSIRKEIQQYKKKNKKKPHPLNQEQEQNCQTGYSGKKWTGNSKK
jgi:hypothetical protein